MSKREDETTPLSVFPFSFSFLPPFQPVFLQPSTFWINFLHFIFFPSQPASSTATNCTSILSCSFFFLLVPSKICFLGGACPEAAIHSHMFKYGHEWVAIGCCCSGERRRNCPLGYVRWKGRYGSIFRFYSVVTSELLLQWREVTVDGVFLDRTDRLVLGFERNYLWTRN